MQIIFLDIDGVLTHSATVHGKIPVTIECRAYTRTYEQFDLNCVQRLNRLTATRNVVFHTSWATSHDVASLETILRARGWLVGAVLGKVSGRGVQAIEKWLSHNALGASWVLIDDDGDKDYPNHPRVVRPSFWKGGLQDEHIDQALRILASPRDGA